MFLVSIIVDSCYIYVMAAKGSQGDLECNHKGREDVAMSIHPKTSRPLGFLSSSALLTR